MHDIRVRLGGNATAPLADDRTALGKFMPNKCMASKSHGTCFLIVFAQTLAGRCTPQGFPDRGSGQRVATVLMYLTTPEVSLPARHTLMQLMRMALQTVRRYSESSQTCAKEH